MTSSDLVERIWRKDPTLWSDGEAGRAIVGRLGWLDAPDTMRAHVAHVRAFAEEVRGAGFTQVYLVGMGGSSLSAEVLREGATGTSGAGLPLRLLDTTDEATILDAARQSKRERTLYLIASKSGTTIEVAAMERFFWESEAAGDRPARFAAITDPGTPLERLAREKGYRRCFVNAADIGGRFSVLSLFGLVPAALVGIDPGRMLEAGRRMADRCRRDDAANAALSLGAALGEAARMGRDKMTLLLPDGVRTFGLWVEQLVAESTGKAGRGILPIVDEPPGAACEYGADRIFVASGRRSETLSGFDPALLDDLKRGGHAVLHLEDVAVTEPSDLGGEFFRWEFATAVAGALLQVNPFDEPNVKEAKDRTSAVLRTPASGGSLEDDAVARATPRDIRAALETLGPGAYVAFLSYLPPDAGAAAELARIRADIRRRFRVATTIGTGPRYLHSTGQYHKGGPPAGLHVILTTDDSTATPVPGEPYTFATLKRAQAIGDLQALAARGRRVLNIHLPPGDRAAALRESFA
jgi:glucose-6-phosphate isomerase